MVGGRGRTRLGWAAATVAALGLSFVVGAASERTPARAHPPVARVQAEMLPEPTPPAPSPGLDPLLFRAAAKRPPAAPVLARLPQVDLNGLSVAGVPRAALRAYVTAARVANREDQTCHVRWWLLAGIGLVESAHGRSGGSASAGWNGIARPPIYGPRLDGKHGYAAIHDTDHGTLDGDKRWDRAVGPMQFLPQTWQRWGTSTNGHLRNPQDIRAAAVAAARYLCAGSADVSQPQGIATAVFSYNHSFEYVRLVLSVAARYAGIDPRSLGIDRLPHDKQKPKKQEPNNQIPRAARSAPPSTSSSLPTVQRGTTSPVPAPSLSTGGSEPTASSPPPSPSDTPTSPPVTDPTDTPTVAAT
jgi:hypothetical protein